MEVLYQLSYSPARDGHDTSAGRAISARYARPVMSDAERTTPDIPQHRYNAALANEIEAKWQDRWDADHTFWAPNPVGDLAGGQTRAVRPRGAAGTVGGPAQVVVRAHDQSPLP